MIECTFIDVDKVLTYSGTEPVSLIEAKEHLRVDFTDDDSLISAMITAAREAIERYCHISIVQKTVTLTLKASEQLKSIFAQPFQVREQFNEFELPSGPIISVLSVTSVNSDGLTVTTLTPNYDYYVSGSKFKTIRISNAFDNNIIVYTAGYATVPEGLKLAIKNELAYRYEGRGEPQYAIRATAFTEQGVAISAQILANPYRRMTNI